MSYLSYLTALLSDNSNPQHEEHLYQIEALCRMMIEELVPVIVRQELEKTRSDLWVNIQTTINGEKNDFPDVQEYIKRLIEGRA